MLYHGWMQASDAGQTEGSAREPAASASPPQTRALDASECIRMYSEDPAYELRCDARLPSARAPFAEVGPRIIRDA